MVEGSGWYLDFVMSGNDGGDLVEVVKGSGEEGFDEVVRQANIS